LFLFIEQEIKNSLQLFFVFIFCFLITIPVYCFIVVIYLPHLTSLAVVLRHSTIATTASRHSPPFSLQLVPPASTAAVNAAAVHHPSPLLSYHCPTLPFCLHLSPSTFKICSQNKIYQCFYIFLSLKVFSN
jgi:hypothetical protein